MRAPLSKRPTWSLFQSMIPDLLKLKLKLEIMSTIYDIEAREVLDSRGNPTVEVDVILAAAQSAGLRCPPAPARRTRSDRIARWRQETLFGQRRDQSSQECDRKDFARPGGSRRPGPAHGRQDHDRSGWDRHQIQARCQRNPGRFVANAKAAAEALGLPLFKYLGGPNAKLLLFRWPTSSMAEPIPTPRSISRSS